MEVQNSRWIHAINTEERVRLSWYLKNRAFVLASVSDAPLKYKVDPKEIQRVKDERRENYQEKEHFPCKQFKDPDNAPVPDLPNIMKPVPPEVTNLLYNSSNNGRVTYLRERVKSIPEDRFTVPVCTSYNYGWRMWDCAKTMGGTKVGKSAIVQETFYRRRTGIEKDPDWYTVPERTSPTICNCI